MLKHLFTKKYPKETKYLFEGTSNWNQFNKKLQEVAEQLNKRLGADYKTVLGDGFEVFIEGFIKLTENDNRFGISNYTPVQSKDDYGVDGYGDNIRGNKSAIQIKYRIDPTYFLTAQKDGLDSMITEALLTENIIFGKSNDYRHYIFTSAKGLNNKTDDNKFGGRVKCYGIDTIKSIVDNNQNFWNNFKTLL
jgi:hypothetical protein